MKKITLASWESRFWAWLIDIILANVLIGLFFDFLNLANLTFFSIEILSDPTILNFEIFGVHGALMFVYWTVLEGYKGQSIGKAVMNLKVTNRRGKRIGFIRAALESFGKAFILPIDCLIGWLAMGGEKLRLFNRLSNTIVIKTEYKTPDEVEYEKE